MNLAIVPDSAPAEKSGQAVIPHAKPPNLQAQIEQTERLLTGLYQLQAQLDIWTARWRAYAIDSAEFEVIYEMLNQVGLIGWAEPLGIDDLRVAVG